MTTLAAPTDTTATAIIDAALWLREQVRHKRVASLSLTFLEEPIEVTYMAGGATVVIDGGQPIDLTDADLDAERWEIA